MNADELAIAATATKEIAKDVYQDTFHPAMQEIGKNVHTLSKIVTIALTPISAMVWGYEQIKAYIVPALEERLKNIPKEKIIEPDSMIAGPTLEILRYAGQKKELRELYSNLLASAMNSDTAHEAHPAFVDILKQLSPDEAILLSYMRTTTSYPMVLIQSKEKDGISYRIILSDFSLIPFKAKCKNPELGPSYLENLSRLGILKLDYRNYVVDPPNSYVDINSHQLIITVCDQIKNADRISEVLKGSVTFTEFGKQFYKVCIE
jgi:hypothetical protein